MILVGTYLIMGIYKYFVQTQTVAAYEIVKVKTVQIVGDTDWAQVKDKALVNLELSRTICLQYVSKLIQQFNQLVK